MTGDSALAATLKRDRAVVLMALLVIAALALSYTVWASRQMMSGHAMASPAADMSGMAMADMPGMDMHGMHMSAMAPAFTHWSPAHFGFLFLMWAVMMVGMMAPSVAPMVLLYAGVARFNASRGEPFAPAGWFASGYLLAWTLFALVATLAQWGLEYLALITPMTMSGTRTFGGIVLIAVGIYQWLPLKERCLTQCRQPLAFVQQHGGFQQSARGSVRLGFVHGMYCVGCCWALMTLLFVGGVMNFFWIAGLMIFVLLEKLLPGGPYLSRLAGFAAVLVGMFMIAG